MSLMDSYRTLLELYIQGGIRVTIPGDAGTAAADGSPPAYTAQAVIQPDGDVIVTVSKDAFSKASLMQELFQAIVARLHDLNRLVLFLKRLNAFACLALFFFPVLFLIPLGNERSLGQAVRQILGGSGGSPWLSALLSLAPGILSFGFRLGLKSFLLNRLKQLTSGTD